MWVKTPVYVEGFDRGAENLPPRRRQRQTGDRAARLIDAGAIAGEIVLEAHARLERAARHVLEDALEALLVAIAKDVIAQPVERQIGGHAEHPSGKLGRRLIGGPRTVNAENTPVKE